jgi:phospholipid/cholesterol/gamma-HCH transport system substrate-binding protein
MRRLIAITCLVAGGAGLLLAGPAIGGDGGPYEVRAVFDNGAFIVAGEDVRIAGANVGSVSSVDISQPGEIVSVRNGRSRPDPGKAVVTLSITDPGFQDFREDASCLIRPQSLLGEKYVECEPTQPHAPGSNPSPSLEEIPDGQAGAGQHLLPLENNGKAVDLDLVNNIQREPFRERFRLIINDLGAGLAARGRDLDAIVKRANPALQQTDRVLNILAQQNQVLSQLAKDSDTDLAPLARERAHVQGFINNANEAGQATAERRGDLEAGLHKLPATLRELRPTMVELQNLADQATPVTADFGAAAPALTKATQELGPFSRAATISLKSLGKNAAKAGQPLKASDPVIRQIRDFAKSAKGGAKELARILVSLKETNGFERLMDFLFNGTGAVNNFDQFGNFLRANLQKTNCNDYQPAPTAGCNANWLKAVVQSANSAFVAPETKPPKTQKRSKGPAVKETTGEPRRDLGPGLEGHQPGGSANSLRDAEPLYNFLLGNGR